MEHHKKCPLIELYFLLIIFIQDTSGANLLAIFTLPVPSHYKVYDPIIHELAARGHNVTYLSPYPLKIELPNLKFIPIENNRGAIIGGGTLSKLMGVSVFRVSTTMILNMVKTHGDSIYPTKAIQDIVQSSDKYDAIISSSTLIIQGALASLQHKFNAIGIDIIPLGDSSIVNEFSGFSDNSNYMIDYKCSYEKNIKDYNYFDRLYNFYILILSNISNMITLPIYEMQSNAYFKYPGWEDRPPIKTLMANKSLILTSSHFTVGYSTPKAPHVKEIGGVNVRDPKPLPKDLKNFMDEAKDGVVYFSLGTNFNSSWETSDEFRTSFIKVLSNLKQRVLWKWDSDTPPIQSKTIIFSKFFPQVDILAHPNLRLFITQGGILSLLEAVHCGVPILCVPFISDQPKNAQVVQNNEIGLRLNPENVTESSLSWAINEILSNPKFAQNAKMRSVLFHDRQMKPLEEAVYWIEYVLRYGNVLQPKAVELSFIQLHNIDIWLTVSFSFLAPYFIIKIIQNKAF